MEYFTLLYIIILCFLNFISSLLIGMFVNRITKIPSFQTLHTKITKMGVLFLLLLINCLLLFTARHLIKRTVNLPSQLEMSVVKFSSNVIIAWTMFGTQTYMKELLTDVSC